MGTRRRPIFAAKRRKYAQGGGAVDTDVSASQSLVTLSASSGETGTTLTLTITARNAAGQGLSGKAITSVTIDPVGAASVSGSGNTNVTGVATRTLTLGDVGNGNTVTVVCDGVTLDTVPTFDVTAAVPVITITDQPDNANVNTGDPASFTVAATVTLGATLSYQWQEDDGGGFANLSNAGVYSNVTTTTLNISDATGLDGYLYRCVVSATGGASPVNSNSATLTVTDPSALVWAETVWAPGSLPQSVWAPNVWEGMT